MHDQPANSLLLTDTSGSVEALFQHIDDAIAGGAKSLFLLAGAANGFTPDLLDEKLRALPVPIFGGIFPQILANGERMERGSLVYGQPHTAIVRQIANISAEEQNFIASIDAFAADIPPGSTLLTLFDSASKRVAALLESLYEVIGDNCSYIGGGTGSPGFEPIPGIFSNDGLLQDCAQIAVLPQPMQIGAEHGWRKFAGPFLVTGAYNNVITTLDYQPAFEVYRRVVETASKQQCHSSLFFDFACTYPFGLEQLEGDILIRSPLRHEENNLICVGEVPINHMVYILKGQPDDLLAANRQCVQTATARGVNGSPALLFDCVSRPAFLGERFAEEMDIIYNALPDNTLLIGAFTLGEIANNGDTCLELHNKTIVLGITPPQGETP